MRYLEYKQIQGLKTIKYRQLDPLFGRGLPLFYANRFIHIKGKTIQTRLYLKLIYLMKSNRYIPMDMFYLVLGRHYLNVKTVHIRVAGRPYHIPVPIPVAEGYSMLIRFLVYGSQSQPGFTYEQRLLQEFEATLYALGKSYTIQTIDKMYERAQEDKIFAHFRWR